MHLTKGQRKFTIPLWQKFYEYNYDKISKIYTQIVLILGGGINF